MSTMPEPAAPGVHRLARVIGLDETRAADPVAVLARRARERNRTTAGFLRAVHEAGRAVAGTAEKLPRPDEFSPDEVAARLGWSSSMAGRWVDLAADLTGRLPAVLTAMEFGDLDEVKARALSDWTRDLAADHAQAVADEVLPTAPRLAVAELISWVQELAVALDPEWAARREARARTRARVVGSPNPSGTANLSGRDLPVDEAVAALARVDALAAEVRSAGVRRPIGRIRAAVYLRLLDGFGAGLDDDALVRALVALLRDADDPGPDDPGPDDPGPDDPGPDDPGPDDSGPDDSGPDDPDPDDSGPEERPTDGEPAGEDPQAPEVDDPPPPTRGLRRGTVELRVRLSTLLGLDELPGQVPGWGPVLAGTARSMAADRHDAEWRLVITDPAGRLRHVLLTRHRPRRSRPPGRAGPGATVRGRGIVEIQTSTLLLSAPLPHVPEWAGLLAWARHRTAGLPRDGSCPDDGPAATDAAHRRRARAELDRWVRTRDRCCVGTVCGRPARACDLDHTSDWALSGVTAAWNLGALCRHEHRAKHVGGWRLAQPDAGEFVWTSRAGARYLRSVRPVTAPLPPPLPAPLGRRPVPWPGPTPRDGWLDAASGAAGGRAPAPRADPPGGATSGPPAGARPQPVDPGRYDGPPPF